MRILLIGVAGSIGSRVAELLLAEGHEVFGIDNLCPAYDVRPKDYRLGTLEGSLGYYAGAARVQAVALEPGEQLTRYQS